jgi:hypothetical protein
MFHVTAHDTHHNTALERANVSGYELKNIEEENSSIRIMCATIQNPQSEVRMR